MTELGWSFFSVWNESLEQRPERELKPRDYCWASELGGALADRYLKMHAVAPSNPPDPRALRKFEAGNLMEWVVEQVLKRAGILTDSQKWLEYQYPEMLRVTGKLDFLAGGKVDPEKAKAEVDALGLPEMFTRGTEAIIKHFAEDYPNGLTSAVLEIKSCSAYKFDSYERGGPDPRHILQTFHYLKSGGAEQGHVVYICKDDLRMLEFPVTLAKEFELPYKSDIQTMTYIYNSGDIEPKELPLEPAIIFDDHDGKFSVNWKITYSNYLIKLYSYKTGAEYEGVTKPIVARWNRILGRVAAQKEMTDDNKAGLEEMCKQFPNLDKILEVVKVRGMEETVEEEEK